MTENQGTYYEVFALHEYVQEKQIKTAWIRVGAAFPNSDGSFNLRLRALPITDPKTGTANLHMRLPRPRDNGQVPLHDEAYIPFDSDNMPEDL